MQIKQIYVIFNRLLILLLSSSLLLVKNSHAAENPYAGVSLVKLTLIYYHDIFCSDECRKHIIDGCSKITGQLHKLICREEVQLIRPKKLIEAWSKKQYQQGHIDLTLKEAGIEHAKAHIISIMPFIPKLTGRDATTQQITGIFKRHALNTVYYTFKNISTGEISSIHSTPSHGFYLKNRRAFLPVEDITEKDTLITSNGNHVKRVNYRAGTSVTCDNTANIPVLTYNLEVLEKHVYFAGSDKILVHNACTCGECGLVCESTLAVRTHSYREHSSTVYECGFNECKVRRGRIDQMNLHQWRHHLVSNIYACPECGNQCEDEVLLQTHMESECRSKLKKLKKAGGTSRHHPYAGRKSRAMTETNSPASQQVLPPPPSLVPFSPSGQKPLYPSLAQLAKEFEKKILQPYEGWMKELSDAGLK